MEFKLKDIAHINQETLKKDSFPNNFLYLDTKNLTSGKFGELVYFDTKKDKVPSRARRIVKENDILISTVRPNQRHYGFITKDQESYIVSTGFAVITPDETKVNPYFLYKFLTLENITNYLQSIAENSTSAYPAIKPSVLSELSIILPDKTIQGYISKLLRSLDDKVNLNEQIIANLEELSQTLFKRWFVDFEFPDEDGNPYKFSGGEMVDSELGEIPKNWSIKIVKEIAESFNSIRKPLSKLEREKRESIYPYYGATKIIDYVDNYIFDGKYILVGEDGTVQTETGNPFIQYVWGKFWVSNHAHILKGKLISDELLMLYLKNTNVVPYITGAVQPKLNKKNLNSIKFVIADKETIIKFENFIKSYFQKIRILNKENKKLIELRDTLLPKLMSGELEIPDDVEVNMDELSI
ncbi:MAG: restriction endonuclease subunit S [Staphylococcus warneri]|uniref:restriction endonuclease subunit S n=1 Tax=Staphylococcus epidermidis TaxID=1282 RepID=UPI00026BFF0C|nr:restriction endonuclease subunit S [Staphylococcus epidermidis]MDU4493435.1 restriction endonuclease subunit S [Staphylococcus warneri]EJE46148.1 type I restriction modification DNA specificity domain protein [Staphylococcus epidermidis NIH051475]KDP67707.1 type I restriction modification DNA specificity domain protein [Staphylococcus epidermidis VCU036]MDU4503714.1 restriction endonuclease subunit S [Staphylococcus warneri]MDU5653765.1 restriction endonuclease subunit S [Staphylococcus epi